MAADCQSQNRNQAKLGRRKENKYLLMNLFGQVKSNDSGNCEAKAASYYWKHIFPDFLAFSGNVCPPPITC